MFQVIARRDDKVGYNIILADIPEEMKEDSIVFMPELSSKEQDHITYASKYTHKSGHIIVKLVRSDGFDPFDRPKSLSHSLVIPSEEYSSNSLLYYSSPLIHTDLFADVNKDPVILKENTFRETENKILEKLDLEKLRELIVAAMISKKVVLLPSLSQTGIFELSSVIDKSIPYEASYDFSLITYSDASCRKHLVHNILYFFSEDHKSDNGIEFKGLGSKVRKIAQKEKSYLDEYIEMIIKNDFEKILEEHAKWVIGMYHDEHKELQKLFTNRYQLNMPFSRRNKFHAQLINYFSKFEE
ncbi:MAG: hypothetical protein GOP50_09215 [Candidatus Heimdallarchaeota archaeon]|nr:hypothetical protein [Candidatus Heimdallarchaeota archaeon]